MLGRMHGFITVWLLAFGVGLSGIGLLCAAEPPSSEELEEPWMTPIAIPADPELEQQIQEVQDALSAIHRQMVRRKEALNKTPDATAKTALYGELEALRQEREDLEALLHDLVDEAKLSERTKIDEALARARWFERQQQYWEQKEERTRDLQP